MAHVPGPGQNGSAAGVLNLTLSVIGLTVRNQGASCTATVATTGGTLPYSWLWTTGNPAAVFFSAAASPITGVQMQEVIQTEAYILYCTVTDANGNVSTGSTTVNVTYPEAPA